MTAKGLKMLVAGLLVGLFVSSPMADTIYTPIFPQGNAFEWCWAAATQALCSYFDKNFKKTLNEVASVYTKSTSKCPPIDSVPILFPKIVEANGSAINMKTVFKKGQMTWSEYKKESDEKRLFIFVIKWDVPGVYHCIVATGYIKDSTLLYYMDGGNEDKRWKSWKEITGVNTIISGNTKWGTWLGSLLVTSFTPLSNETKKSVAPFTILNAYQDTKSGFVFLRFNSRIESFASVRIYNLRGACVYDMTAPTGFNQGYFQVPYQFSSGNYLVSLIQNSWDTPREAVKVFSVVK